MRLIYLQAAINLCDQEGTTALMVATLFGNERLVKLMLDAGADFSALTAFLDESPNSLLIILSAVLLLFRYTLVVRSFTL